VDKRFLEDCLAEGMSLEKIGDLTGKHPSTVGHHLKRHGLRANGADRYSPRGELDRELLTAAVDEGLTLAEMSAEFERSASTMFVLENRGSYRCIKCRSENVAVWRRRAKHRLVREAGGRCRLCGYDRYLGALQFHHLDPEAKAFSLSARGCTRSFAELRAEAAKCILLCGNCHAEVEHGFTEVVP
jgi:hypothetical protein